MPRALGRQDSREDCGDCSMSRVSKHNRLKILFLPAWYPSETNPVAGVFIKEHARAASLYNDIVVLYAYVDPRPQRRHLYRVSEDIEDGIRTIRVKYSGILLYLWRKLAAKNQKREGSSDSKAKATILGKLLAIPRILVGDLLYCWSIFATFRKLAREGWKPDVIHAHVFTAGVPAVLLGKLYRIPVVITEHYIYFPPRILSFWERVKARFSMNRAQIVLPPTNAYKEAIESYGIKNKFQVVPNVVNTKKFYPSSSEREGGKKQLLFVGNLVPKKGIPFLLEALCQIKEQRQDFTLYIVGDGPNRGEYEELVPKLGLTGIVKFHGMKQKDEVAEFMQNCDFFVMPSLYEGFGVVYAEAMACGKPVIATNARGPDEIVDEEMGILVPPQDTKALREAIEYMLDNYQNYSPESIAQYAKDRFSYEVIGKMLDTAYRDATSGFIKK